MGQPPPAEAATRSRRTSHTMAGSNGPKIALTAKLPYTGLLRVAAAARATASHTYANQKYNFSDGLGLRSTAGEVVQHRVQLGVHLRDVRLEHAQTTRQGQLERKQVLTAGVADHAVAGGRELGHGHAQKAVGVVEVEHLVSLVERHLGHLQRLLDRGVGQRCVRVPGLVSVEITVPGVLEGAAEDFVHLIEAVAPALAEGFVAELLVRGQERVQNDSGDDVHDRERGEADEQHEEYLRVWVVLGRVVAHLVPPLERRDGEQRVHGAEQRAPVVVHFLVFHLSEYPRGEDGAPVDHHEHEDGRPHQGADAEEDAFGESPELRASHANLVQPQQRQAGP
ncbi:wall-associated receptor kinase galacturonan-binding protein [Babesia caballi]|uniref:Wall-associated receptor kinase galacturonan-binding protein n=1 Tax=Babesia caballi TaxID=5871 RepID=A0AAV4LMU5_BABCB|nr:wall-associated receptor kinase galacturonan-binding protein [Babesia caballi]